MLVSMIMLLMISSIILLMTMMLNLTSMKKQNEREKSSPFECGFDPKSSSRLPFSLQFFLIAMMFLIFDIEISLLFPISISINNSNPISYLMMTLTMLIILIMGLIHEWNQGSLNWKK